MIGLLGIGTVTAQDVPSAARMLDTSSVPAEGGPVVVTITVTGATQGVVVETLPDGFTYESSSLDGSQVREDGQVISFILADSDDNPFTYTVMVSQTGQISGKLVTDRVDYGVTGASRVTVQDDAGPSAARMLDTSSVPTEGGPVVVTITVTGATQGVVVETLPDGFTYESSSLDGSQVREDGQVISFILADSDDNPFTYTVMVSQTGSISGKLVSDRVDYGVTGAFTVTVGQPAPPPPPPPTLPIDRVGMVSFSMDMPKVGAALTATLTDPDGGVTGTTWQWSRSDTMDGTYANIANATSESYTPVDDDVDKYLKAMASYRDTHRSGRTAEAMTANAVGSATPTTGSALGDHYDSAANGGNADGQLDTPEMLSAVSDYFAEGSTITRPEMLELVRIYFAS